MEIEQWETPSWPDGFFVVGVIVSLTMTHKTTWPTVLKYFIWIYVRDLNWSWEKFSWLIWDMSEGRVCTVTMATLGSSCCGSSWRNPLWVIIFAKVFKSKLNQFCICFHCHRMVPVNLTSREVSMEIQSNIFVAPILTNNIYNILTFDLTLKFNNTL